ncbi:helix-turn-helix domain-containing protein [Granulicella tundricola]|uniref:Transcriptional regulator, AraC family n=1 Tax=Granulicella tundricola (strain ATCC BAA-1859 / DSM 23138 / MP5ACTX9) TaxID=1198114 RepID=E8X6P6_GRATM|nr:AraC family transcriptional regulator [Granulicella tundricola]ADW71196.1 transcriptional regulator, AraC family [Granulicella tundricola MP5ACTX9]
METHNELGEKQFLIGLNPGPPPDYVAHDYSDYSVYTAEQHRSVWERHTHDCTQITVAMSPAQVRGEWQGANGHIERREMNGDMAWIVPPNIPHVIHFDRPATLIHLYLTESFFHKMVENAPESVELSLVPSILVRDNFLVELAHSLHRESQYGKLSPLFTDSIATLTATHLVRSYSNTTRSVPAFRGGMGPSRERRVLSYIAEHLNESITLEELARVAEISPNYLIALFRQSMGMTPHKYVVQTRVEHARTLLKQRDLPLLEIAHRCGFQDQSQFTTVFRRYSGLTPGQFRRSL